MIMKTDNKSYAAVQQTAHNTTNWVGHKNNSNKGYETAQTFISPGDGGLEAIEIFPSVVTKPGKMTMTFHLFDEQEKSFGPAIGSSSIEMNYDKNGRWLAFGMNGVQLHKGKTYGFRLQSPDTFIGLGEAVGSHQQPPFAAGEEWQFTEGENKGQCFAYFSLAFKVDMRA